MQPDPNKKQKKFWNLLELSKKNVKLYNWKIYFKNFILKNEKD